MTKGDTVEVGGTDATSGGTNIEENRSGEFGHLDLGIVTAPCERKLRVVAY